MKKVLLILILFINACTGTIYVIGFEESRLDISRDQCKKEALEKRVSKFCFDKVEFNSYYYDKNISEYYFLDESMFKGVVKEKYSKNKKELGIVILYLKRDILSNKNNRYLEHYYYEIKNDNNIINISKKRHEITVKVNYHDAYNSITLIFRDYLNNYKKVYNYTYNEYQKRFDIIYTDDKNIIYSTMINNK